MDRELERNLALQVQPGDSADEFIVCGRGTLHLSILNENMRREGYEFCVGPPQVITQENEDGKKTEPYEECIVEVAQEYMVPSRPSIPVSGSVFRPPTPSPHLLGEGVLLGDTSIPWRPPYLYHTTDFNN